MARMSDDNETSCTASGMPLLSEFNLEHNIRMVLVFVSRGEMSVDQAWEAIDDRLSDYRSWHLHRQSM